MRVILFGATGMVGSAALIECLADARVSSVVSVTRRPGAVSHPKLREVVHKDFLNFAAIQADFTQADACFFCLGVSSAGMSEADYTRVTYDIALAAATAIVAVSPGATFCFVSGAGTDSSEKGRAMWARVKGRTENAILALPFRASYMFRPGAILPRKGVRSATRLYNVFYALTAPVAPLLRRAFPGLVTTSDELGQALIRVAVAGYPRRILEGRDINLAASAT